MTERRDFLVMTLIDMVRRAVAPPEHQVVPRGIHDVRVRLGHHERANVAALRLRSGQVGSGTTIALRCCLNHSYVLEYMCVKDYDFFDFKELF